MESRVSPETLRSFHSAHGKSSGVYEVSVQAASPITKPADPTPRRHAPPASGAARSGLTGLELPSQLL